MKDSKAKLKSLQRSLDELRNSLSEQQLPEPTEELWKQFHARLQTHLASEQR
jgi:hypothetical protein